MNLVEWLKARQGDETNEQFAVRLGISPSLWSLLQSGHRRPTLRLLRKITRAFPEHRDTIVDLTLESCAA